MMPSDAMLASRQRHRFALRAAVLRSVALTVLCAMPLVGCVRGHVVTLWAPASAADAAVPHAVVEGPAAHSAANNTAATHSGGTVHPHPCGAVVERSVRRLPPPGAPGYREGSERVVEFDTEGRVLRRWAMPVDAVPVALADKRLGVEWRTDRYLVIADDGGLSGGRPVRSQFEAIDCPAPLSREFSGSAYLRCVVLPDAGSGRPRRLAFESPCT